MALPPAAAPADDASVAAAPMDDAGAMAADAGGAEEEEGGNVLLTVLQEADGTFRLIQGDEDDSGGMAADEGMGATDEGEGKVYDSKGALLKAILDILNETDSAAGADGTSEDQFQSGFGAAPGGGAAAPPGPAGVMPQKY